jgi:hypothetical protein
MPTNPKVRQKNDAKIKKMQSFRDLDKSKKLEMTRLQPGMPKTIKIKRFSFRLELGKKGLLGIDTGSDC